MNRKTLLNNKVLYLILMIILIIFIMPQKSLAKSSIGSTKITLSYYSKDYTGSEIIPSVTVKVGNKKLKKDKDYTVSYRNNVNVGTAKVTIRGKGNYKGTVTKTFKITKKNISSVKSSLSESEYIYCGSPYKPEVTLIDRNGRNLKKDKDYTVSYRNNVNIGTAKVTIRGKGNYKGTITKTFKITRIPLKDNIFNVTLKYNWKGMNVEEFKRKSSDGNFVISKGKMKASYLVKKGSKYTIYIPKAATNFRSIELVDLRIIHEKFNTLKLGTDYNVTYARSDTQTIITIIGKGIYTGSKTIVCQSN